MKKVIHLLTLLLFTSFVLSAQSSTGTWSSRVTGSTISYTVTDAPTPLTDATGSYMTVVYLENLSLKKIGTNALQDDINWLLAAGYRVIELDYAHHANAVSTKLNEDIIAINDALFAGDFCGTTNSSKYRSYVLFEGYRIARDVPYFEDNPLTYNYPAAYTVGDSLRMDIIYPASPSVAVPVVLSFSYSNSSFGSANRNQRLNLGNTLAGFNDSFLQGAPAHGIAWAIADHPKYCPWGNGKPVDGKTDTYKSYQVNPDAAQKVKSAVRTLRVEGEKLGLSGKIGIYGFSRGSDAGSMAIGDRVVEEYENAGFNKGSTDEVQAAALGSGVFDFTKIYTTTGDGDGNLETRCPWAWGELETNYAVWEKQGSAYLVETAATAPVLFFYNTDDANYYREQIGFLIEKLETLGVPTSTLVNYGSGHSVPQTAAALTGLYDFFRTYLTPPSTDHSTAVDNAASLTNNESPFRLKVTYQEDGVIQCNFQLDQPATVSISVFETSGRLVSQELNQYASGGQYTRFLRVNSSFAPYIIQLKADQLRETGKLSF